jgi:hypothetical protein
MDYMRLSQSRWTQMLAIVSQMSSSTEDQVVKSLASLAYEVRHSTSFRTMLQHLTWRGRGDVLIGVIKHDVYVIKWRCLPQYNQPRHMWLSFPVPYFLPQSYQI